MRALGKRALPAQVEVEGRTYVYRETFKHDFFAATAAYDGADGRVIVKIHRTAPFVFIPLRWLGRWLARRECKAFTRLADVAGVPSLIGRVGPTGMVRRFIPGKPLARGRWVADDFHPRLRALIDTMHARGIAYVDLEKCENVLVGEDGRPYLFDFQISWHAPRWRGRELRAFRWLTRLFQAGDRYHLVKLQRRTRPDQLSPEALSASYRRPWYVRLHRLVTGPFLWLRRRVLGRIEPARALGERGRIVQSRIERVPRHGS